MTINQQHGRHTNRDNHSYLLIPLNPQPQIIQAMLQSLRRDRADEAFLRLRLQTLALVSSTIPIGTAVRELRDRI